MAGIVPGSGLTWFLSIDGVAGSVSDPGHPGALPVWRAEFTMSRPAVPAGGTPALPVFGPLTVDVTDDVGLADMLTLLSRGTHVSGATLTGRTTSGATPYDACKLDLGEVVVTGVTDVPGGGYELTLGYRVLDLTTLGAASNGTLTPTSFGWDRATNSQANAVGDGAEAVVGGTAPVRYFLAIAGLDGGSSDAQHVGWFDVGNFGLVATAPWSVVGGSGSGGAPAFGPLTVNIVEDAGITDLLRQVADGKHFSSARLQGVTSGVTPAPIYDLTLSDVLVKAVRDGTFTGYSLTLDYRTIELVTRGSAGSMIVETGDFGYDRVTASDPGSATPTPVPGSRPGEGTPGSGFDFTYYLALDGVAGESTSTSQPGALLATGYSFTALQSSSIGGAGSGFGGVSDFGPLTIVLDSETGLASALALVSSGKLVSGATLTARTTGAQAFDAYKLDLENVVVTGVEDLHNGGWLLSLDYGRIDLVTFAQTTIGAVVQEGQFGWDTVNQVPATAVGDGAEAIVPTTAAAKYFLLVDGVDGGSTDAAHLGWFELTRLDLDVARLAASGGGAAVAATFHPLFVAFEELDGVADLVQRAATGTHLRGVRVEGMSGGANPVAVYDLTLSDVIVRRVTDYAWEHQVELDYGRIELITRGQSNIGPFVQTGAFGWDRATNTAFTPTSLPSLVAGNAPGDGTPGVSQLDFSARLILGGVSGDQAEASHPGAFQVARYDFEVTQSAAVAGSGGGGGAPIATFGPLTLTIVGDTGQARLLSLLASGQPVPAASLTIQPVGGQATGGQALDLSTIDLGDVTVLGIDDTDRSGYAVTLGYRQIEVTTRTLAGPSTVVTGAFGWDIAKNKIADVAGDSAEPVVPPTDAARYFLVVDGVDGGSTDAAHKGWFEVSDHALKTSIVAGKPSFATLEVAFAEDSGLVDLLRIAATGAPLKGVRLEGVTAEATPRAVYDLTLSTVTIAEIHDIANDGFEVKFDYSRIELITNGTTSNGPLVQTGAFGFDIATATAFTPTGLPPLAPFSPVASLLAHEDAYVVQQGQALSISAALGVLANDEVPAGVPATAALRVAPLHGTVQLAANGGFAYTPAAGFSGIDSFGYRLAAGTGSTSDSEATIEIVPVNVANGGATTTLALVALTAEQQIASTYIAFFGRAADAAGFDFWVGEFNRNLPTQGPAALFANIASSFGISNEARTLYPFLVNPFGASDTQIGAFLDTVYDNMFNRSPDAAGLAYWTGQVRATLAANQFVGSVLVDIMSGAQDTAAGKDITTLLGKVAVSIAYVEEQQEHHTVWAGASDIAAATALLRDVTADPQTVLIGVRNAEVIIAAHA